MSTYKRLTTENPKGNMENMLNITKIIDREVYLRDWNGEGDLNLVDFCKAQYKEIYGTDLDYDVGAKVGSEDFGEFMDDDSLLSAFYWMAVGYAELRHRLSAYEDSGLSPEEIMKNKELIKAWSEGRVVVLPAPIGAPIYTIYRFIELDGRITDGIEELRLSGYINEGGCEFYTTYDENGTCDVEPGNLYTNREEAEEALRHERERKCRICSCTWDHACEGGCYWVEPDLCSKCACD